ncbi:isochorismatase family protein [Ruegeria sp. 2205SS24-7]|uniref:isochorismatase family protein n=1 Tax=Ruegeria discodermiae TaxID=3064389 RepID=UPI002741654D|nr:isochorismatase family protein [Ruegeria sp. 2205SS24-7]MDP5218896.1 isochorismatase family protein [Ruegeria sp. 2205SS24-7]
MPHKVVDPSFVSLMDAHAPVNQLGSGFTFTEGPIWHPVEKHLLFSDMPADVRRRWTPDGQVSEVMRPSHKGNGMTYDADLNLLVCEHATSSVTRFRHDGRREVLTSHFEGKELNSPNDICVNARGDVYFTDPTYGRMAGFGVERPLQQGFQGVYMLPAGHRPGDEPILVSDRYMFTQPNGLCFSPCERFMWVNDTEQTNIRMFDVAPDGRLTNARIFASGISEARREGVPDGMKTDVNGNVYVTAPGGVWVYSFHGIKLGEIEVPQKAANLHWGGDNWDKLFICASTGLYSVQMKTRGHVEPFMGPKADLPQDLPAQHAAGLRVDAKRTALIIQDMQNDVIIDGGAFAETGSPDHAREQNVVENARRLADAARKAGVTVIHVWLVCEPGYPAFPQNCALFKGLKEAGALQRGTWGVAPAAGLEAQSGDLVVEKMSMSAWPTSRLEAHLASAGIDTIINTGAWTNMSVEHTARTAADKGYRVILPEDACSTMNADWHNASINYAMQNVAEVTDVDSVIAALG